MELGVGDEHWDYTLDEDDRLVQVSKGVYTSGAVLVNEFTVQYSYDSMGRMLRRDNGSEVTTFVWDGWDLLSETTDSMVTTYLVPDGLVWSFSRGEDVFQVHTDALGSVRVVTDSDGDVVARFEYSSWGELLPGSFDSVGLALRFVGGLGVRTHLETGLLSMRHRWYDANSQRFISRDPIGLYGGSNAYTYSVNAPNDFVDPMGLAPGPLTPSDFPHEERFAKETGCCEAAKKAGLDPAMVCGILYHENRYHNIISWTKDMINSKSGGTIEARGHAGPFALGSRDVDQLVRRANELPPALRNSVMNTFGKMSKSERVMALQDPRVATTFFANFQALRVAANKMHKMSPEAQADALTLQHNAPTPRNGFYHVEWRENKEYYFVAFNVVCEDRCKSK